MRASLKLLLVLLLTIPLHLFAGPHRYEFDGVNPADPVPPAPDSTATDSRTGPHPDKLAMTDVTVDAGTPSLTLHLHHPRAYTLSRRRMHSSEAWVQIGTTTASDRSWTDTGVQVGVAYEYRLQWTGTTSPYAGDTLATYTAGGIEVDRTGYRGCMVLLVASDAAFALDYEIDRLRSDLTGEGWRVETLVVAPDDDWHGDAASETIRGQLQTLYANAPADDKPSMLYVLGHVPVPWSGTWQLSTSHPEGSYFGYVIDGHSDHDGAAPTDQYYADMDGIWTDTADLSHTTARQANAAGDKRWDPIATPSDLEMGVGRVDLHGMSVHHPFTEMDLLRRYLDKAHDYRHGRLPVTNRGLHVQINSVGGNRSADDLALRSFSGVFGLNGYEYRDTLWGYEHRLDYVNTSAENSEGPYFFAAITGGGGAYTGDVNYHTSHFADEASQAVIWFGFQSYYWDWAIENNLMRSQIAAEGSSLGAFSVAHSGWFLHHMGLGSTIGDSVRESINNHDSTGPYTGWESSDPRSYSGRTHQGYMGDPAIRPFPMRPVSGFTAQVNGGEVALSWTASADAELGYHVYRSTEGRHGRYTRLTGLTPVSTGITSGTVTYTDSSAPGGEIHYMVRAVRREQTGAGTFLNASTGVFTAVMDESAPVMAVSLISGSFLMPVGDVSGLLSTDLTISNTGSGSLTGLAVRSNTLWLEVGLSGNTISLSVNVSAEDLQVGTWKGSVTVTADGGLSARIPVLLEVAGDQVSVVAGHDGHTQQDDPDAVFFNGKGEQLRVNLHDDAFLRFDLSGSAGKVAGSAVLQLGIDFASSDTLSVYAFSEDTWVEDTLSFNTRPNVTAHKGSQVYSGNGLRAGDILTIDVTSWVNSSLAASDEQIGFYIETDDADGSGFGLHSGEGAGPRPRLTVTFGPRILTEPQDTSVASGQGAILQVSAIGTGTLSYQWYQGTHGDTSIPVGGDSDTLLTSAISQETFFWVRVTDEAGAGTDSRTARVGILTFPAITIQPVDDMVLPSSTATLHVEATGGNLSYQWYEGSAGDTSRPLPGEQTETLVIADVTESRSFWVRVSNALGQVDSVAVVAGVDARAPSLKVNLGADAGAGWNSVVSYAAFNGNTVLTDSQLVYTTGDEAEGVSLTLTRTDTNEPFYDHFTTIPLAGYPEGWLNDAAASSAWGIGLGYDMKYEISGLPAGTYQIEAYVYLTSTTASANDGSTYPAYKLDTNRLLAGVSGSTAATSGEYDSSSFDADAHPAQVLRWTEVVVGEGETVELLSTSSAATKEFPVLNAFIIRGVSLNLPRPSLTAPPQSVTVNEGDTATLTVKATASEGSLSYQWYQGVSGDTAVPVRVDSGSFTTPVLNETTGYWVRVTDENGYTDSDTAVVTVQQSSPAERILFIGNSFTNGYVNPAQDYNAANVTDLNGTDYGGMPGIFQKLAADSGYPVEVGIESVNGSTLLGRYPGKVSLVTAPTWDRYVLQARSQEAMQDGRGAGASASLFTATVGNWKTAIQNANPQAKVWLYAPWASQTYVGEGEYYSTVEGVDTFLSEINYANYNGFTSLGLDGWVPVGQAFQDAGAAGLTDLFHVDDHHANAAGSYLAAVMMYRQLLGGDPRLLPDGPGSAPAALGLTAFQTQTIHQLAYEFVYPNVQPLPPSILTPPEDASVFIGDTASLYVEAIGSSLSYQWYQGVSGDTSIPLSGAGTDSLTTGVMHAEGTFDYWVRVSNANGTVDSQTATVTVTASGGGGTGMGWEAYHNTEALVSNPNESLVSKGNAADTAYALVKYADGAAADGATITVSYTGTWTMNAARAAAVMPNANTDAHTLFDGKLVLNGWTTFVSTANSPAAVIRFDNLDPDSRYSVRLSLNRGSDFKDTQLELMDASASTAVSSDGIQTVSPTAVAMNSNNTASGYVAGWDDIEPGADGGTGFAIRIVPGPEENFIYLPQLIRLTCTPQGPEPGTYEAWMADYNLTGSDMHDFADPDHDGVINRMEYALRLHPGLGQAGGVPTGGVMKENEEVFQLIRYRRNLEATDLTYVIEASDDLDDPNGWAALAIDPADETVIDPDVEGDGSVELVEIRVNVTGKPLQFLRLQAVR